MDESTTTVSGGRERTMTLTRAKLNLTIAQAKLDVAKATLKQKKQDWDRCRHYTRASR